MSNPILKMRNLIQTMALPVSEIESQDGWNSKSKNAIRAWLIDTISKVANGESIPVVDVERGLEAWGIHQGALLGQVNEVLNELRLLCNPVN